MSNKERPKLRLVGKDDLDELWDDDGADLVEEAPAAARAKERLPRKREFARVPFSWLRMLERDGGFPAWIRLYLWLWYRSSEGKKPVRLTNEKATEVRLDRASKLRRLRHLETRGLVTVTRQGRRAPFVTVLPFRRRQRR